MVDDLMLMSVFRVNESRYMKQPGVEVETGSAEYARIHLRSQLLLYPLSSEIHVVVADDHLYRDPSTETVLEPFKHGTVGLRYPLQRLAGTSAPVNARPDAAHSGSLGNIREVKPVTEQNDALRPILRPAGTQMLEEQPELVSMSWPI